MLASIVLASALLSPPDAECLAKNIYFEARNQSYSGKIAVAHVVLNRVESMDYPDNVCDVVKQAKLDRNGNPIRNMCQFSWYCDGLSDKPKELGEWMDSVDVAREALILWDNGFDITEGSKWYHAKNVKPKWASAFDYVVQIDDHLFYKDK